MAERRGISFGYVAGWDRHDSPVFDRNQRVWNEGVCDIHRLRVHDPRGYIRLHIGKNYFRQALRYNLDAYDCLLNLITDPDENPKTLETFRKMLSRYRGRVINRPEAVLRTSRDKVARRLAGAPGLEVPQVVRIDGSRPERAVKTIGGSGMRYPLILREAGAHTGQIVGLVADEQGLLRSLAARRSYYATEFVDFRSEDGRYRKYRFFFIGGAIVFRHMVASDSWNVHGRDRTRFMAGAADLIEEEKRLFELGLEGFAPSVPPMLAEVRERMGLDFFGLDCAIRADGEAILFEANATMNFLPFVEDPQFDYVKSCLRPAQLAFHELLYGEPLAER